MPRCSACATRTEPRGRQLADEAECAFEPLPEITSLDRFDLVVNATPLGMGDAEQSSPLPPRLYRSGMTVFEMVYRPAVTPFVADALAQGATVIDGLEMFLHQAITQFALHTAKPAPREAMRRVLEEARA